MRRTISLALRTALTLSVTAPALAFDDGAFYKANTFDSLAPCSQRGAIHRIDP